LTYTHQLIIIQTTVKCRLPWQKALSGLTQRYEIL